MTSMYSVQWTRNDSIRLGEVAQQVGLLPDEAERALTLGARFQARGFNDWEIQHMIHTQCQLRADLERSYNQGTISLSDYRKLQSIKEW